MRVGHVGLGATIILMIQMYLFFVFHFCRQCDSARPMLLPANTSLLSVSKGLTVKIAEQASSGVQTPLVDVIPMGAMWTGGVTMFFDHAQGSNLPNARTEGVLLDL